MLRRILSFARKPYRAMEFSLCQVPVVSLLDLSGPACQKFILIITLFFLLCCKEQSKIRNEIKSQSFRMEFRPTLGIEFIVNCSIMIEINTFVSNCVDF